MLKTVKKSEDRDLERFKGMEDRLVTCLLLAHQIDPQGIDLSKNQPSPQQIGADQNRLWLHNWVRPKLEAWQEEQSAALLMRLIDELESIQTTSGAKS